MLEPLAVDPRRSVAPAANSMASARLVFPAPAGPTSAITRVPFADSPAMRLSLRPVHGRASRIVEALGRLSGNFHRPPVSSRWQEGNGLARAWLGTARSNTDGKHRRSCSEGCNCAARREGQGRRQPDADPRARMEDRKSTRLNSSHVEISYAVFCLKKK